MDYAPLLSVIVAFSLVYPAFTTCVRYRLPIDGLFIVFAAVTIAAIAAKVGGRRARFLNDYLSCSCDSA